MLYILQHRADYSWCKPHWEDGSTCGDEPVEDKRSRITLLSKQSAIQTKGCRLIYLNLRPGGKWLDNMMSHPMKSDSVWQHLSLFLQPMISCALHLALFWPCRRTSMHYEVKVITAKKNWQRCLLILSAGIRTWGTGAALNSMELLDWLSCLNCITVSFVIVFFQKPESFKHKKLKNKYFHCDVQGNEVGGQRGWAEGGNLKTLLNFVELTTPALGTSWTWTEDILTTGIL